MCKLKIKPFVKWAGGKKQLLEKLEERMPKEYNRYYEPFIGGGALLLDVQPHIAVINDVNEQLLNVYSQLKANAEAVISKIEEYDSYYCGDALECSDTCHYANARDCEEARNCYKEYYLQMREKYNEKIKLQALDIECAALMIWINKHCFNGLYRVNSKGLFNVPYNNKVNGNSMDKENLKNISQYLNENKVEIRKGDFEEACKDVEPGDFVYFDSPYIPESTTANFTDYTKEGFNYDAHCRLARLFKQLDAKGIKVMLSNNDVELVHNLYEGFHIENVDAARMINRDASKRKGKEVIITNY